MWYVCREVFVRRMEVARIYDVQVMLLFSVLGLTLAISEVCTLSHYSLMGCARDT